LPELQGSYALAIICQDMPDRIFCVRKDGPLVLGVGKDSQYLASDIPAILEHTQEMIMLEDYEIAMLTRDKIEVYDMLGNPVHKTPLHIDWNIQAAEKCGFTHFMLKEIHETPTALRETFDYYTCNNGLSKNFDAISASEAQALSRITVVACGTAYHAGLVGKTLIERLARIPVDADIASEFRYKGPIVNPKDLCIVLSQSGETADTIAAMREFKRLGGNIIAICNAIGSTITREADHVLYTIAGPEIAVASTKAYVSQLFVLYLLALDIAYKRGNIDKTILEESLRHLAAMPEQIKAILSDENKSLIQRIANRSYNQKNVFFIGRGLDFMLAQEASLKLKEISYINSEAYAAGELKHGTIALIEQDTLVVAIATQNNLVNKTISNIEEVRYTRRENFDRYQP
jgi:glucosamine--fructose-6-phosphate aminotransferase (isomerizing)